MDNKKRPKLKPICVSPAVYKRLSKRRAPGQTFGGAIEELLNKAEALKVKKNEL